MRNVLRHLRLRVKKILRRTLEPQLKCLVHRRGGVHGSGGAADSRPQPRGRVATSRVDLHVVPPLQRHHQHLQPLPDVPSRQDLHARARILCQPAC